MDQASLDLQRKNAARSGGSGGSGGSTKQAAADPYALAYNDIFNSANPYATFKGKESQYASVLTASQMEALRAQANAWNAQYGKKSTPKLSSKAISELQKPKRDMSGGILGKKGMVM